MKALKILTLAALISTAGINAAAVNDFGVAAARVAQGAPNANDFNNLGNALITDNGGDDRVAALVRNCRNLRDGAFVRQLVDSVAVILGVNPAQAGQNGAAILLVAQNIDALDRNIAAAAAAANLGPAAAGRAVLGAVSAAIAGNNNALTVAFSNHLGQNPLFQGANPSLRINDINALLFAASQDNSAGAFRAAINIAQGFQQHVLQQVIDGGHGLPNNDNNNAAVVGAGVGADGLPNNNNNNNAAVVGAGVGADGLPNNNNNNAAVVGADGLPNNNNNNNAAVVGAGDPQQQQQQAPNNNAAAVVGGGDPQQQQQQANAGGGNDQPDNNEGDDQQPQQAFPKLSVEQIMQKTQLKRSIAEGIYNQVASKNGAVLGANDRLTNTGSLSSKQVADLETALRHNEVMVEDVLQQQNNDADDDQQAAALPKLTVEQIMQKTQLKRSIAEGIYNQVASKNGAVLGANDRLTNTGSLSSRQVADLETALRHNEAMVDEDQNE